MSDLFILAFSGTKIGQKSGIRHRNRRAGEAHLPVGQRTDQGVTDGENIAIDRTGGSEPPRRCGLSGPRLRSPFRQDASARGPLAGPDAMDSTPLAQRATIVNPRVQTTR